MALFKRSKVEPKEDAPTPGPLYAAGKRFSIAGNHVATAERDIFRHFDFREFWRSLSFVDEVDYDDERATARLLFFAYRESW